MAIILKKTDVKADQYVYLRQTVYPEPATPGVPQQVLVVGEHKAEIVPEFAYERGLVLDSSPEPKAVDATVPAPEQTPTTTRRTKKSEPQAEE